MCICLLDIFFAIEESFTEYIRGPFRIHHLNFLTIEDTYSYFKFLWWLLTDVPHLDFTVWGADWINLNPHFDNTLTNRAALMIDLSILDWFVL